MKDLSFEIHDGSVKILSDDTRVLLKMKGIDKSFPGVHALSNVDFELWKGEIHALVGENGAGKSTLIKVLTGVEPLDKGEIYLEGNRIQVKSSQHAQSLGISTVYQEVNLCPNLSVAENIFIGREPIKNGKINWKEINAKSEKALARLNIKLDVTKKLDEYSIAIQQMTAIARAVDIQAKVLILDEPTSSLDKNEVQKLFHIMKKLKAEGMGILFITHFLDQIYEVTDRITVLRNSELVGVYETGGLPRVQLVAKMIGREFDGLRDPLSGKCRDLLKCDKKTFYKAAGLGRKGTIAPFDLSIDKGEVVGLAGLLGSGRTETANIIFGVQRPDSGEAQIDGRTVNINTPSEAIKNGMAYCPENRKTEGVVAQLSVRENIILALQGKKGLSKLLSKKEQEEITEKYIKLLSIKTPSGEQIVGNLSGGNQQKVIIARWLATDPSLLILDEPTRGIDVGTKAEIMNNVVELAGKGMGVLFISSELEELVRCCTRIAVYRDKVKITEICDDEISEQNMMQTIAGG